MPTTGGNCVTSFLQKDPTKAIAGYYVRTDAQKCYAFTVINFQALNEQDGPIEQNVKLFSVKSKLENNHVGRSHELFFPKWCTAGFQPQTLEQTREILTYNFLIGKNNE